MNTLLKNIAAIANRSESQCKMLYELCGGDIIKYIELEAAIKTNFSAFVPADKEAMEYILQCPVKASEMGEINPKTKQPYTEPFSKVFYTENTLLYKK